jgi:DNA-binding HxlR family transcriptional regulator
VAREPRDGRTRFQDIAAGTAAPRDVLTARLRTPERAGVIKRRRSGEHPPRYQYLRTKAGRELQPILPARKEWATATATPAPRRSSSNTPAARRLPPVDHHRRHPPRPSNHVTACIATLRIEVGDGVRTGQSGLSPGGGAPLRMRVAASTAAARNWARRGGDQGLGSGARR